jgi:tetratricopeptide (TPR) repeat protein
MRQKHSCGSGDVAPPEAVVLHTKSNLANTYQMLGRFEDANQMYRDVYSGNLRLFGEENFHTLSAANNYANALLDLKRFEEAKALLRKMLPVARRVLGENNEITLKTRLCYAVALYKDPAATLDELREAVTTLEDTARIARRVLGGAHPVTKGVEGDLRNASVVLAAREAPPTSA